MGENLEDEQRQRREQQQLDAQKRFRAADRSRGRQQIVGGAVLIVLGIAIAVVAIANFSPRPATSFVLAIPIGGGILLAMNGLRLTRSGNEAVAADWLASAQLSSNAEHFKLLATGTGVYNTWVIDGSWLYDKNGNKHDLNTLAGGRMQENNAPAGWSGRLTLFFTDAKPTIKAFDRPIGANHQTYTQLVARLDEFLQANDPKATFVNGTLRSFLLGMALAVAAIGLVIGVIVVADVLL